MPCGHGVKATKHKIVKEKRGRFKSSRNYLARVIEVFPLKNNLPSHRQAARLTQGRVLLCKRRLLLSLTWGNSRLPSGDGLSGHVQFLGQVGLRQVVFFAQLNQLIMQFHISSLQIISLTPCILNQVRFTFGQAALAFSFSGVPRSALRPYPSRRGGGAALRRRPCPLCPGSRPGGAL